LDRILYILEDSRVLVLLTRTEMSAHLPMLDLRVLCLDEAIEPAIEDDTDLANVVTASLKVYTIYTSGSTGRPKGVVVEQRQILNYMHAIVQRFGLKPGMQYAMLQPLAVDACNTVLFPSLCAGGTLHVMPYERASDPYAVLDYFRRNPIDVLKIAPSHMAALIEACPSEDMLPRHVLALGGEASRWDWILDVLQPLTPPASRIFIHYGPTETTVGVLTYCIELGSLPRGALVPLGRPLSNTSVYVLDRQMQPVPVGVVGEIWVSGDCVARGYLNRPDLTAERFVPNPLASERGSRLYRSGDLARWLPGGQIEFLGRADHQVKIRGYRIELGEIEAVLREHAAVKMALVMAGEDVEGKRLRAYVVPKRSKIAGGSRTDETGYNSQDLGDELREFLRERLPDYMIPAAIVILHALPLGPQGKVDLRALPVPSGETKPSHGLEMPRNLVQAHLVQIWERILKVNPIGIHDDFFRLGGHSLLAVRMMTAIRQRFKREIPLAVLFRNPTIAHLSELLTQSREERSASLLVDIQPEGDMLPFFCVHPIGGGVFCYAELARALGRDRPFYGVQAPDENMIGESITTIEQMATLYNKEIRRQQPDGPYLLGGWSMGGLIAFEMAQQLCRQGQNVGLLALFDTHLPPKNREVIEGHDDLSILTRFAADISRLIGKDFGNPEHFCALDEDAQRAMLVDALKRNGVLAKNEASEEIDQRLSVFARNARAVDDYSLQPIKLRIDLFWAADAGESKSIAPQWQHWAAGGIELHAVPGDHYTILTRPNVSALAERLTQRLNKVQQETMAIGRLGGGISYP